ncbi:thermonuclease family protein [Acaryochloris sp. IP29b_bin.137]|uniref:thermonuclease family protein n=1 Tax=Acaryochloris sp. IP29b_bin.137 TaxID=2969217 RepID=UPI00263282C4|nr:thermonuclease family protein [Acaryochloris sp. IP29b_bin.137]
MGQTDNKLNAEISLAIDLDRNTSAQSSAKQSGGFDADWSVISVHDGDTIRVRQGNRTERIRFACIDAPELKQPLGRDSGDHLKQLIANSGNRVALNLISTDRYGRQVAEVFVNGQLVQSQQVSNGMAYVYHKYLSDCPSADIVRLAEQQAKQKKVGVWLGNHQTPWAFRKRK